MDEDTGVPLHNAVSNGSFSIAVSLSLCQGSTAMAYIGYYPGPLE